MDSGATHSSLSAPTKQERLEDTGPTVHAVPVTRAQGHSVTERPLRAQERFPRPSPGVPGLELCPTKGRCLGTCRPRRPSSAGRGFSGSTPDVARLFSETAVGDRGAGSGGPTEPAGTGTVCRAARGRRGGAGRSPPLFGFAFTSGFTRPVSVREAKGNINTVIREQTLFNNLGGFDKRTRV